MIQCTNPIENFFKFSLFIFPRHSQTPVMDAMAVLFLEFLDMQLHHDQMFDFLYIVGSCYFRLYLFSRRDFAIQLFHLAFDPSIPYFAIALHMTHPTPPLPPAAPSAPAAAPSASPAQVVPDLQLDSKSNPSEAIGSLSSSSGSNLGYSLAKPSMAKCFLTEQTPDRWTTLYSMALFWQCAVLGHGSSSLVSDTDSSLKCPLRTKQECTSLSQTTYLFVCIGPIHVTFFCICTKSGDRYVIYVCILLRLCYVTTCFLLKYLFTFSVLRYRLYFYT